MTNQTPIAETTAKKPGRAWVALLHKIHRIWVMTGLILMVVFLIYQFFACRAPGFAHAALNSDTRVHVTRSADSWLFEPIATVRTRPRHTGLIFFPGSMVDPAAYAPLARKVAENGYPVAIVLLPFRLAPSEGHKEEVMAHARNVISEYPVAPMRWMVGGHSLGGALATRFARDNADLTGGLILVGTSHPRRFDLSQFPRTVVKIYGTRDGLASPEEVHDFARNLPTHTRFVEIPGGNHSQFGWYGFQLGDQTATISHTEQQERLVRTVLETLAADKKQDHGPVRP